MHRTYESGAVYLLSSIYLYHYIGIYPSIGRSKGPPKLSCASGPPSNLIEPCSQRDRDSWEACNRLLNKLFINQDCTIRRIVVPKRTSCEHKVSIATQRKQESMVGIFMFCTAICPFSCPREPPSLAPRVPLGRFLMECRYIPLLLGKHILTIWGYISKTANAGLSDLISFDRQ